jgi:putative endonuclease
MFYVYLLEEIVSGELYTGYTKDLKKRIAEHNAGKNISTKNRCWHCIYYEACSFEEDARRREKYFKTSQGRRSLKLRLRAFFRRRAN